MKIVVCPDSFKGCLEAKEVSKIIAETLQEEFPSAEIMELPLADGGEGTADIIKLKYYPYIKSTFASDPIGREIPVKYYSDRKEEKAFIESAEIIGLPLLSLEERNPLITTSYGLGEVIKEIIEKGYKEITVSLGGSATCDGGIGMLQALPDLNDIKTKFTIICDVNNPLLGEKGAVNIFAPQKGAKKEDLPVLEKRLEDWVEYAKEKYFCKKDDIIKEGAGAAGGLGFAFQTILKAKYKKGIDFIMDIVNFDEAIENADLIITGEGKVDAQSLMGKVLSGVLKKTKNKNIPVISFGGEIEDEEILFKSGLLDLYKISDENLTKMENMNPEIAKINIQKNIKKMLKSNIFQQLSK